MNPKLSTEVEQLVADNADGVAQVQGENGTYFILNESAMEVRQQVLEGIHDADKGNLSEWNADEIKTEGRRRKEQREQP